MDVSFLRSLGPPFIVFWVMLGLSVRGWGGAVIFGAAVPARDDIHQLNGRSDIAETSPAGMPFDAVPLLPLMDANLSGMANSDFTLSDLEETDGGVYAQLWWHGEA